MTTIVLDTGPLYALFDLGDRYHDRALAFLRSAADPLVTNIPVICEVSFLFRRSQANTVKFLAWAHEYLRVDQSLMDDVPRILDLLNKYADLRPDFADASLVALCERIGTRRIATIDSDFTVYRSIANEPFENVFLGTGQA